MKRSLLFILLLLTQYGLAQIPKPQKNTSVNDFAHVLSKEQVNALNMQIDSLQKVSQVQLALVLVETLPAKYTIDKFAVQIGHKWHIGKAGNGIVYVAAIKQHKQHIELDSAAFKKVSVFEQSGLLDAIKPYFRQADYSGGLTNLVQQLSQHFVPPAAPVAQPVAEKAAPAKPEERLIWPLFLFFALIIGLIFAIVAFIKMCIKNKGNGWGGYPPGTSFWERRYYRRSRWGWGSDRNYNITNNYYDSGSSSSYSSNNNRDDDDDNRRNSSSSSGGSFSNSGGSSSDW